MNEILKIFIFNNIIGNYCSGDYYFVAHSKEEAVIEADLFANKHNVTVDNNENYIIEWDEETVEEVEIIPGFLSLNRIYLPMTK